MLVAANNYGFNALNNNLYKKNQNKYLKMIENLFLIKQQRLEN